MRNQYISEVTFQAQPSAHTCRDEQMKVTEAKLPGSLVESMSH